MKLNLSSVRATALLALVASVGAAGHGHSHGHHRHGHQHRDASDVTVEKRGGQCQFPTDAGMVEITPHKQNAGWAMSPDQPCLPGNYCPYACPSGMVSMQWDPQANSYIYPLSTNGGLYCDNDGNIRKPFPDRPYCQDGTGTVGAASKCGKEVSFCQTVLPGNEAMLIPTRVKDLATLAVPGTDYWCGTAAHYYINPPGIGTEIGCVWGTSANPYGNWSPYVAGANTVDNGDTYLKIGWNPIYLEPTTPFRDVVPDYGVEIECEGDGCNGMPCKIDPTVNSVNEMIGSNTKGAGGATFCVVTVPKGQKAHVVVFESESGQGGGQESSSAEPVPSSTTSSYTTSTTPTPTPSTTSTTTTSTSTSTSTSSPTPSTTFISSTTSTPTITSSSEHSPTAPLSSENPSSPTPSSTMWPMQSPPSYKYTPNIFVNTGADGAASTSSPSTPSPSTSSPSTSSTSTSSPAPTPSSSASTFAVPMGMLLTVLAAVLNL
ncbi:SUN domain protein Adg3 [Aspergillus sp. HF37]|nr:SUN domain protein Adg3 [Aspergillus sp. HF37]